MVRGHPLRCFYHTTCLEQHIVSLDHAALSLRLQLSQLYIDFELLLVAF